jgi:hypothetical protein
MLSPGAHLDNHDLALYVCEKLDSDRSSIIQSHVRICAACKDRLVAGFLAQLTAQNQKEAANSNERRAEWRFQSGERGYVQPLCPLSFERPAVQIVDVSKGGFSLIMSSFLATGTIVHVCIGTTIALGEVRSCQATNDNQFRLGIRVPDARELKLKLS